MMRPQKARKKGHGCPEKGTWVPRRKGEDRVPKKGHGCPEEKAKIKKFVTNRQNIFRALRFWGFLFFLIWVKTDNDPPKKASECVTLQ